MQGEEKKLRQNTTHPPDGKDKCPPTTEGIPIMTVERAKFGRYYIGSRSLLLLSYKENVIR